MHELNLLPPMRRLLLQQENVVLAATRFIQRFMVGLAILFVAGGVAGGLLWFTLRHSSQSAALQRAIGEYQQLRSTINSQNNHLVAITKQEKKHFRWSVLLPSLFEAIPAGVTI